ncbi:MAG: monovalent cation/H+ antiporter subunit D, partial [Thauera sp.]|nr:monovalent cation/H+ antiporter subunit D [Thauera sp.]
MNHALILPILLPAVVGAVLVIAARYDRVLARVLSLASMVLMLAIALGLFVLASDGSVRTYALGAWPAPFGIVLALDRLAALMLLLGAVLGLGVLLYASNGWDQRGKHFHPLYQFQLMGINGAFLTGDFFNLFVFFEILLIASYG